jgi:putative FmdB family regulatory protein
MPIYEYNCKKCNKHFEIVQKITDKPEAKCPVCGTPAKRLISQTSFALKGGGWYKDGYGPGKGTGGGETKKGPEGKPAETKTSETKKTEVKKETKE